MRIHSNLSFFLKKDTKIFVLSSVFVSLSYDFRITSTPVSCAFEFRVPLNMAYPITRSRSSESSKALCGSLPTPRKKCRVSKICPSRSLTSVARNPAVWTHEVTSSPAKSKAQPPSPLLQLPGEVRNQIYYLVLTESEPISYKVPLGPALLRTNRQIRNEARHIYYECNTFVIGEDPSNDEKWLQRMSRERKQNIKYIYKRGTSLMIPPIFDLLSQFWNLSLVMELPMAKLYDISSRGHLKDLHGFSGTIVTKSCQHEGTWFHSAIWELWDKKLQQVLDHLQDSCSEPCKSHADMERSGCKSVLHLRLTHCCSRAHCCYLFG